MDTLNKLQELQQEILNFGDVVSHTENPADIDFRNACSLFSQYLSSELSAINAQIRLKDIRPEMQQTTTQLCELSELITPDASESSANYSWPEKLLNFCSQLHTLKSIAA
ncbi:hypothetical protein MNBD_GAMMA08-1287 [hydrothermal vent metagenome]|uniref:Uncharacterized protein n=1 Tax=hydrothermal vent metagenome TaxID=652676 RepID=A0A3B0X7F9_9ZZZZ